jgi:hypothetical protein
MGVDVTREQALEAALRKFEMHYPQGINTWLDDAWREARAALAMPPAQVEFTRGWEAATAALAAECKRLENDVIQGDWLVDGFEIARERMLAAIAKVSHE